MNLVDTVVACSAAVQIVEWIELERENLVRQLHLLRSVFTLKPRSHRNAAVQRKTTHGAAR